MRKREFMPRHFRVSCGCHFLRRECDDGKVQYYNKVFFEKNYNKVNTYKMTYMTSNVSKSKTQSSEQKPF